MSQPTQLQPIQTQAPQTQLTVPTPTAQPPQIIQVQLPSQLSQPPAYAPAFQGDVGTFLVLIALTVLVKLLR